MSRVHVQANDYQTRREKILVWRNEGRNCERKPNIPPEHEILARNARSCEFRADVKGRHREYQDVQESFNVFEIHLVIFLFARTKQSNLDFLLNVQALSLSLTCIPYEAIF